MRCPMKTNKEFDLVIIGAGASAVTFLASVYSLKKCETPLNIAVIDRLENTGYGSVYKADHPWLRMNSYSRSLSAYREAPNHFINWLSKQNISPQTEEYEVPSRNTFGAYLHSVIQELVYEGKNKSLNIEIHNDYIVDIIKPDKAKHYSIVGEKKCYQSDQIVISTGVQEVQDCYNLKQDIHPRYIGRPFPMKDKLSQIPSSSSVGIIGSSLTAFDALLSLRRSGHKGPIVLASRSGCLPQVKPNGYKEVPLKYLNESFRLKVIQTGEVSLRSVLKKLIKEFKDRNLCWREVFYPKSRQPETLDAFSDRVKSANKEDDDFEFRMEVHDYLNSILPYLCDDDLIYVREKFVKNVFYMNGAIPRISAKRMHDSLGNNTSLFSGLNDIKTNEKSFNLYSPQGVCTVEFLINATGPSYETRNSIKNPMVQKIARCNGVDLEKIGLSYNVHPYSAEVRIGEDIMGGVRAIGYAAQVQHPFNNCFENISEVNYLAAQAFYDEFTVKHKILYGVKK